MKKLLQRFLIFLAGIPLIIAAVLFLPCYNHLFLNILVVIFSSLGALELRNMLMKKGLPVSVIEALIFGALAPALVTLILSFDLNFWLLPVFFFAAALWLLVSSVFLPHVQLDNYINRMAAGFTVLIYPGFFLSWICAMGKLDGILILMFLLIPIIGDSAAWAAGILFGKNNRGIIKVSPNKSAAGFIGGLFGSVVITVATAAFSPGLFESRFFSKWLAALILGLITGIAAALGDLCESAIKRGAGFKDSGSLIPGRGGVLDSVDSIALAAPVFYLIWIFLFSGV